MSNEPTIEQMNEVIGMFDGWELIIGDPNAICLSCDTGAQPSGWCTCDQKTDRFRKNGKTVASTYFQYHSSWDWLMPALLKAKALYLKFDSGLLRDQLKMRYIAAENELRNLNLINTHYCLYQLIQWYNKQKETKQ